MSVGVCASLQLCNSHSQGQKQTVCELTDVVAKKFSLTAILFNVKYKFCIAIHLIFLSSWLSVALGWPDRSLCTNDPVATLFYFKCLFITLTRYVRTVVF